MKLGWGQYVLNLNSKFVSLKDFSDWLSNIAEAASIVTPLPQTEKYDDKRKGNRDYTCAAYQRRHERKDDTKDNSYTVVCLICNKNCAKWQECPTFLKANIDERWKYVTKFKRCFSCLLCRHQVRQCRVRTRCGKDGCELKHHTLLHHYKPKTLDNTKTEKRETEKVEPKKSETEQEKKEPEIVGHQKGRQKNLQVLLRIVPVTIIGNNNKEIKICAMFDEASTITLIDAELAEELELDGPIKPIHITWTNEQTYEDNDSRSLTVNLKGYDSKIFELDDVRTTTLRLPTQTVREESLKNRWPHLKDIPFQTYTESRPLLLIGQDNIGLTIAREVVEGPTNSPMASKSKLGWVVHGPTKRFYNRIDNDFILHVNENRNDNELNFLLKQLFEFDFVDINEESKTLNDNDARAMEIIQKTCKQTDDKHWKVGLLWKKENIKLPESKKAAMKRLLHVERKMDDNEKLCKQYSEQVEDFIRKGYARELTEEEMKEKHDRTWYLPHFPVTNPRKPDKFRFVFDATAKSNGQCLNDKLLTGPDLFNNLIHLLFGLRQYKIGFVADIQEMFLQVKIKEEDTHALRFLWRGRERDKPPKEMIMQVMIFGAICSPTLAMYVTRKNAENFQEIYPEAVHAINKRCYMDDYVDSKDTLQEAVTLAKQVIDIFEAGAFNLRNFVSNSKEFMEQIPAEKRAKNFQEINIDVKPRIERVLGMTWDCTTDNFTFQTALLKHKQELLKNTDIPTKRQALTIIMSIFDPLGFLSPLTMKGRLLMQDIWKTKTDWDEPIQTDLLSQWTGLMYELEKIKSMTVPRCYTKNLEEIFDVQLHILCDASLRGYAAVGYFRLTDKTGKIKVIFIYARSRVASIKPNLKIPKLELQAAVLAARLYKFIIDGHSIKINSTIFWTDSTITWHRIRADSMKYEAYTARRIREIQSLTDKDSWRWIPTEENVADEATRGETSKYIEHMRWIKGPTFLYLKEEDWPKPKNKDREKIEDEGIKRENVLVIQENTSLIDFTRFSQYRRVIRTMSWIWRFINNCRKLKKKHSNDLTRDEIIKGELECVKIAQEESFPDEYRQLSELKQIKKSSRLYSLSPIFQDGLLRLDSRVKRSPDIDIDTTKPIILDSKHRLTKLLIQSYHIKFMHQGRETIINELRQRFWIINIRSAVRLCTRTCVECQKNRAKPSAPMMAPLPEYRVTRYSRPFTAVGLDYFGPIEVTIGRRREKRYGALFTCLAIRAVHIEVVSSLTTDGAIMAVRRMTARRGYPDKIFSDNGTNFRGADRELRDMFKTIDNDAISSFCAGNGIKWTFNTPLAPHMGGAWERMVRSIKIALRAALKEQTPKEETLLTVLCEVENIINSRPITYVSVDPDDAASLSPNDLLIGPKATVPNYIIDTNIRKQWQIAQNLADRFWTRWLKEYVTMLAPRSKWREETKSLETGDIVRIMDDNQPRNVWLTGVVTQINPGQDGIIRSVNVKTKFGTYRRPVVKLIKIEIDKLFL